MVPACVYVHRVRAWCPLEVRKGHQIPGVTHGYKPPCRCWELNLGPQQEQQVLLTVGELFINLYNIYRSSPIHHALPPASHCPILCPSQLSYGLCPIGAAHTCMRVQPPTGLKSPLQKVQKWKTSNTYFLILKIWCPSSPKFSKDKGKTGK